MRVVVDTNAWVSGLIVPDGPPGEVLRAVRDGRLTAVMSWDLAAEIVDVLARPKLRRYEISAADIEDLVFALAPSLPSVELKVPVRDPGDAPVISAAVAGGAECIISGDADLLRDWTLREWLLERGIEVLTPQELKDRL